MTTSFSVGDPVLVIGRMCTVKTCVGLFGYIERVYTPEECGHKEDTPNLSIILLSYPSFDPDDYLSKGSNEKHGHFDTWSGTARASDLAPLTNVKHLARVAALKAKRAEEEANKEDDPEWDAKLAEMTSPETMAKWKADRAEVEAESARIGKVFPLPGAIKRGNKGGFPAYRDIQQVTHELMGYAQRGPKGCTLTERARWGQCLEVTDQVSFWSPRQEVRDIVKELDLDPMASEHESALYRNHGREYVTNGGLRDVVIRLWNRGAIILYVQDMEGPDTCWASYKETEPKGYQVSYAFRRKLPERSAN